MGGDWLACLGLCVALEAALEALKASAALFLVCGKVCGIVWSECAFFVCGKVCGKVWWEWSGPSALFCAPACFFFDHVTIGKKCCALFQ